MTRDELLRRLVAFDSRSQISNRGIADFICDYVDAPGVRIVRNESPDGTKLNVVAARGAVREDRSGLVLSGHMDTVPFGEPDWTTDPLVLTRREDRFVHLKLRIVVLGRPGHSAYAASGKNAIEMAGAVIQALTGLGRELEAETPPEAAAFGEVRYATLNLATIAGGTALNVIPGRCVLEIGIRLLPGMTGVDVTERVRRAVERAVGQGAYTLEAISESPAMATPEAAPIHGTLCTLAGQAGSRAVSFTTDGGWLGRLGLDCVVFGPGSIQAAHKANEWLPVAEFERAAGLLASVVEECCVAPSG